MSRSLQIWRQGMILRSSSITAGSIWRRKNRLDSGASAPLVYAIFIKRWRGRDHFRSNSARARRRRYGHAGPGYRVRLGNTDYFRSAVAGNDPQRASKLAHSLLHAAHPKPTAGSVHFTLLFLGNSLASVADLEFHGTF